MSVSTSSYRNKRSLLIPSRLLQLQDRWKHKKAVQCPWTARSEDAEGQSSRYLLILHQHPPFPPITPLSPPASCHGPTATLQTSQALAACVRTHAPRFRSAFLLTPGIEDAFLDFEIILCKILPGMTCRGNSSHNFHSVQQFGFKASRSGKTKGCTGMLTEQRGKLPSAYSIFLDIAIQLFVFMNAPFSDKV